MSLQAQQRWAIYLSIWNIDEDTHNIDNRIVEFNDLLTNEEEFAKFVEDHDMAEYWDEFEDVPEMKIGLPKGRETRQLNEY